MCPNECNQWQNSFENIGTLVCKSKGRVEKVHAIMAVRAYNDRDLCIL